MWLLALALAALIATGITLLELVTTKYPHSFFVLLLCPTLYGYSFLYGGVAAVIMLLFSPSKFGVSSWFIEAIIVGISIKALLKITLFSVPIPNSSDVFPIGTESVTRLLEPWLLETISTEEFNGLRQFVKPWVSRHPDPNAVRELIIENLPPSIEDDPNIRAAFIRDLDLKLQYDPKVTRAMEFYIRRLGKKSFVRVFSL
jgi:hypothetical protein